MELRNSSLCSQRNGKLGDRNAITLERARELIAIQGDLGTDTNRGAISLILEEVGRQFDQHTVDSLIDEFALDNEFS